MYLKQIFCYYNYELFSGLILVECNIWMYNGWAIWDLSILNGYLFYTKIINLSVLYKLSNCFIEELKIYSMFYEWLVYFFPIFKDVLCIFIYIILFGVYYVMVRIIFKPLLLKKLYIASRIDIGYLY
jgi:hypothetical protein